MRRLMMWIIYKTVDYLQSNDCLQIVHSQLNSRFNSLYMADSSESFSHHIKPYCPLPMLSKHLSNEETTSRSKVTELQDELLFLKKEMSAKECIFLKEKNILLNKVQLLSMENIQLKQRQQGLVQINQTLTHAIQSKENSQTSSNHPSTKEHDLSLQLEEKQKRIKDLKRHLDDYKDRLNKSEKQFADKSHEYDQIIDRLSQQKKEIATDCEQRIKRIKENIQDMAINKGIVKMILQAFNRANGNDGVIGDKKMDKDNKSKESKQKDVFTKEKYYENSSYLLENSQDFSINLATTEEEHSDQLPSHRKQPAFRGKINFPKQLNHLYQMQSSNRPNKELQGKQMQKKQVELSEVYTEEEEDRSMSRGDSYLCQVCQKVYEEREFIEHMNDCKDIAELQIQKKKIEITLDYLSNTPQPRKSPLSRQPKAFQPSRSRLQLSEIFPAQNPPTNKHRNNSNQYQQTTTARTGVTYQAVGQESSTYRGKSDHRGRYEYY